MSWFDDFVEDPLGSIATVMSFGTIGIEDGKLGKGRALTYLEDIGGEISGANDARDAAWKVDQRIEAERLQKEKDLKDQQKKNMELDIAASRSAGAIATEGASIRSMGNFKLGAGISDEQDFLGL